MSVRRVVVTGMGAVSSAGNGSELLWRAARDGKPCIGPLEVRQPYGGRIKISAQVRDFDIEALLGPKIAPFADPFTAYALVAADEAMAQAGLDPDVRQGSRCASLLGTGAGGMRTCDDGIYNVYFANKRPDALTVPRLIPSAGPSQISMRYGATGPCFAVASACSSGSQAIGLGVQMIRAGMIDRAIVGGTEACATNGSMRAWECLRVLTPDFCRPFAKNRNGMVLGEGAAMFVIEAEDSALARGAKPLAVLAGYGTNSDALDPVRPDAASASACMNMALEDAGLSPQDIDYVNAHGTATVMNDVTEADALNRTFGAHIEKLLVSSTKPVHGHALGAGGALELLISIMALRENIAPPNLNVEIQDPQCAIRLVGDKAIEIPMRAILSNSFAFGGINASLIVTPFRDGLTDVNSHAAPVQRAGPLRVAASPEAVRLFRSQTGWRDADGPPPASFPVVWMRLPEIGQPIRAAAQEVGLPVHEAQHFDYVRPLETGREYDLMLELLRENDPARLIATAEVFDLDGNFVARIVSTLRLIDPKDIPTPDISAPPQGEKS